LSVLCDKQDIEMTALVDWKEAKIKVCSSFIVRKRLKKGRMEGRERRGQFDKFGKLEKQSPIPVECPQQNQCTDIPHSTSYKGGRPRSNWILCPEVCR
jgi:hypothetical protein